jgi:efflux transporter, RND family, MFP subunit
MLRVKYIAVAACMTWMAGCTGKKEDGKVAPVAVQTMEVQDGNVGEMRTYVGTIQESYGSTLSFATLGTVARVLVEEGQAVRRGQLLAVLDNTSAKSAHDLSLSALAQAKDAFRRMDLLYKKGSLPEIRYVDVQTKLAEAQATERITRKTLQDCELRAPFDGLISQRMVDVGNNMAPGIGCFKLVKLGRVEVKISVPENEISGISRGEEVPFTVSALDGRRFLGRVTEKGIQANILSHTYDVTVGVDNADHALLPGMVCSAQIAGRKSGKGIVIPQQAVLIDGEKPFVWVVEAGQAHRRNIVQTGVCDSGVVVSTGVSVGDRVIVSGQNKVSEGSVVKEK